MFLPPWFMAAVWPNLCPNSNKVLLFHQAICHIVFPYFLIFLKIWEYGSIFSIFWRNKYGIYSSLKEAEYGTMRCMFIINTDHWWSVIITTFVLYASIYCCSPTPCTPHDALRWSYGINLTISTITVEWSASTSTFPFELEHFIDIDYMCAMWLYINTKQDVLISKVL